MNTKMWIAFVFGSVITFFIAGCNMSTGGPGPRAWIDSLHWMDQHCHWNQWWFDRMLPRIAGPVRRYCM